MENNIKLIDVAIWPLIILFIIIMFRIQIKSLLSFVGNVKYKDFEIKFNKGLEQVNEEVRNTGIEVKTEIDEKSEIYKLVKISPVFAVMQCWEELEIAAKKKARELAPKEEKFENLKYRPISYLEYTGALTPSTARALRELQSLRNQATHSPGFKITKENAIEYVSLSKAILKQIESIRELPRIKLTALTLLIGEINHLIDSGKYNQITIDDVRYAIKQKRIIPFLIETTQGDSDFSLFVSNGLYSSFVEYYHEQVYQIFSGYAGNERRKWGVENLGLCLLLAWTNEIIQQGAGWHPNEL